MTNRLLWCGISALALLSTAGCHDSPRVLVAQKHVGDRVVRYTLVPSSQTSEDVGPLFDLKMVVCNRRTGGGESGCTESIVLENVAPVTE